MPNMNVYWVKGGGGEKDDTLNFFFFCFSAERSVIAMVILPLLPLWKFMLKIFLGKKCVGVPPPPPPPSDFFRGGAKILASRSSSKSFCPPPPKQTPWCRPCTHLALILKSWYFLASLFQCFGIFVSCKNQTKQWVKRDVQTALHMITFD